MNDRKDGSFIYRHTDADNEFNNLMVERDLSEELPRSVAKVTFKTELVEPAHIDDPIIEINDQLFSAS